ncbi:MAG: LysM peptidoglycan-binding domain-containing protein [Chloroflexota bacterium]
MDRGIAFMLVLFLLTACGQAEINATTQDISELQPYRTNTLLPTWTLIPQSTSAFRPTPTPVVYTVVGGDNLITIAGRFGVSLEALMVANPGVSATALSIGTELVIPVGGVALDDPTPTPAVQVIRQARCWMDTTGGAWCFALVLNELYDLLENISAQFTVLSTDGEELDSQVVFGSLNVLPGGYAMPLLAYFPPPLPREIGVRVQVLTAIRLFPNDPRYLSASIQDVLVQISGSGRSAQVSGRVHIAGDDEEGAGIVWVLATAFDNRGNVIGVRRWDSDSQVESGGMLPFGFQISSIGPPIDRVEFLVEARP